MKDNITTTPEQEQMPLLEVPAKSRWRVDINTIIIICVQAVVIIFTLIMNGNISKTNAMYRDMELQVQKVVTINNMYNDLFSDVPEKVFLSEHLASIILDSTTCANITQMVNRYYASRINTLIENSEFNEVEQIINAGEALQTNVGLQLAKDIGENLYHIVIYSEHYEHDAIRKAQIFEGYGYPSEVHFTPSKLFAVTLGKYPYSEAKVKLQQAKDLYKVQATSWISTGERWLHPVYPLSLVTESEL